MSITLVTGPLRSGTSCVTGLLERCGFDLGRTIRILRNPTEHNPKGHFEPDLLYTINERLLREVPGGPWSLLSVPDAAMLAAVADRRVRYFHLFIRKFDGDVCKDPLFCLTVPHWERQWPQLQRAIFCLRHPLAVAQSMGARYLISEDYALTLWHAYASRFFQGVSRCRVFVFDFDAFLSAPDAAWAALLTWLERPLPAAELRHRCADFFDAESVHWTPAAADTRALPLHIRDLYGRLRAQAAASQPRLRP